MLTDGPLVPGEGDEAICGRRTFSEQLGGMGEPDER
jgi:hypothetical protein